ncbi:MAG: hypothetical protein D3909_17355 [Candidatus Electrothrix sp. ATG1]|nr:hypothetical protein [Candidatus Electrothrix sp. ATG1]
MKLFFVQSFHYISTGNREKEAVSVREGRKVKDFLTRACCVQHLCLNAKICFVKDFLKKR